MSDRQHETYWDIVAREFQKNRQAVGAAWALIPIVLVAIFAPLICSNQPFVFFDGDQTCFPWLRMLFNADQPVDVLMNMALLVFPVWMAGAIVVNRRWGAAGQSHARRWTRLLAVYAVLTLIVLAIVSIPGVRPKNSFATRSFVAEEFQDPKTRHGVYPLIPFGPIEQDLVNAGDRPPFTRKPQSDWRESNDGFVHLFGTDNVGRDIFTRMIYGTRISITVGIFAVSIYLTIGCLLGAIAGYFGGRVDTLISRVIEVVLLFPAFFLILTLVAIFGASVYIIMFVIGITGWPTIARLIRGEVLKQRALDYVHAARALGFSHARIILRHVLPNSIYPALVAAPFGIAGAVITEASLSLLGFGVKPPTPSWGNILKLGSDNYAMWWEVIFPSLAIFMYVTIFNLIGSGLRDAMDPRLRSTR